MSIVNQRELAEILGKTQMTILEWQRQGLPVKSRGGNGRENEYDTAAVLTWCVERERQRVTVETPKDRLARLQADKIELELAEKRLELLPASEVEPAWTAMVNSARAFLMSERDRLAQLLDAAAGFDAKRDLLAEAFDEFLRKLSAYDPESEALTALHLLGDRAGEK